MTVIGRITFVVIVLMCILAAGHVQDSNSATSPSVIATQPIKQFNEVLLDRLKQKQAKTITLHQEKCLADNIYYEASNQPYEGKLAVAFVTLNRLADQDYPDTICGVVYERRHAIYCQFSWVCEKPARYNRTDWLESFAVARQVIMFLTVGTPNLVDPSHGALFFHTTGVSPRWKTSFIPTIQIADHVFYRKPI